MNTENQTNKQYQAGDFIYTSWGYDQTNVEWYKVLELVGKKSLRVIQVCGTYKETGFMCGNTKPTDEILTENVWKDGSQTPVREQVKPFVVRVSDSGTCNMDPGSNGYQRSGWKYDKETNQGHYTSSYA